MDNKLKSNIYVISGGCGTDMEKVVLQFANHLKTKQHVKNFNVLYNENRFDRGVGDEHETFKNFNSVMQSINESYMAIAIPDFNGRFDDFALFEMAYADSDGIPIITLEKPVEITKNIPNGFGSIR